MVGRSSGDLLLDALVACMKATPQRRHRHARVAIKAAVIHAEATFDARARLGVDRAVPLGRWPVTVTTELVKRRTLPPGSGWRTTERYCVVGQCLREPSVRALVELGHGVHLSHTQRRSTSEFALRPPGRRMLSAWA